MSVLVGPKPGHGVRTRAAVARDGGPPLCSVCQDELLDGQPLSVPCLNDHNQHKACMQNWRDARGPFAPCPECRAPLR